MENIISCTKGKSYLRLSIDFDDDSSELFFRLLISFFSKLSKTIIIDAYGLEADVFLPTEVVKKAFDLRRKGESVYMLHEVNRIEVFEKFVDSRWTFIHPFESNFCWDGFLMRKRGEKRRAEVGDLLASVIFGDQESNAALEIHGSNKKVLDATFDLVNELKQKHGHKLVEGLLFKKRIDDLSEWINK